MFCTFLLSIVLLSHCANADVSCKLTQNIMTTEFVADSLISSEGPVYIKSGSGTYKTVLVRTTNGTIYRSLDTGVTWAKIPEVNTSILSIETTQDKTAVLLVGTGGVLWRSLDEAKSFTRILAPGQFSTFTFHPLNRDWVLALTSPGCGALSLSRPCSHDLYLSQDMGLHWGLLRKYVWKANWHGTKARDQLVVIWERRSKEGNQYSYPYSGDVSTSETFWRGKNDNKVVATDVLGFLALDTHIFIATRSPVRDITLSVSKDMGVTFNPVKFPGNLKGYRYRILDSRAGSTYVGVIHDQSANWGNVYASNEFDSDFSLELEHVPCSGRSCDFTPVRGIDGIYIANKYKSLTTTGKGEEPQTFISYDKGAEWNLIPAPTNASGHLHVHGRGSRHTTFYSSSDVIGLIFANGNVGETISQDEVGVYFSRDAGWTWKYVDEDAHIYEFANRGSIVIMAKNEEQTRSIQFSLDEGNSWTGCFMADNPLEVTNVVSDPAFGTPSFIIFGKRGDKGVLISFDCSDLHENDCKGWNSPGDENSDYEYWIPSDRENDDCILGRTIRYIRRKQNSKCRNPERVNLTQATVIKSCPCTDEDYECDYCFVRSTDGKTCVPDTEEKCVGYDPKKPPANCKVSFQASQGYRKVPGDVCNVDTGIDDYEPITLACTGEIFTPSPPTPSPEEKPQQHSSSGVAIFLVIVVLIFAGLAVLWYLAGHNASVRSFLEPYVPPRFMPASSIEAPAGHYTPVRLDESDNSQDDAKEVVLTEEDELATSSSDGNRHRPGQTSLV